MRGVCGSQRIENRTQKTEDGFLDGHVAPCASCHDGESLTSSSHLFRVMYDTCK
jgi:hypothetical protein